MSDSVFGQAYADQYDLLYGEKDYQAECDLIEEVFRRHHQGKIETILDIGCGTGNHAVPLAHRGYQVTGVDLSLSMLLHAREKAAQLPDGIAHPTFVEGDARSVNLDQQFDAVLMMFAVLGYQLTNEDVSAALHTVRRHLKPGGLFVFDFWYGPAVLAIRPSERIKVVPMPDGQLIRATTGTLDTYRHRCEVRYHLWRIGNGRVLNETEESHQMRYFFPQELVYFLGQAGLSLNGLWAFNDMDNVANDSTWNVFAVGRMQ